MLGYRLFLLVLLTISSASLGYLVNDKGKATLGSCYFLLGGLLELSQILQLAGDEFIERNKLWNLKVLRQDVVDGLLLE